MKAIPINKPKRPCKTRDGKTCRHYTDKGLTASCAAKGKCKETGK